jgi:SAM-dependent methyltransferase
MMYADLDYLRFLLSIDSFIGPCLEFGCGYGGETSKAVIESAGLPYFSSDLPGSPNAVDFEIDLLAESFQKQPGVIALRDHQVRSILVLNVLEHVFDPVKLLDNALSLLDLNGKVVIITPVSWPIHKYPIDCQRLLPDFYREYAKRRGLRIQPSSFRWIGAEGEIPADGPIDEALPKFLPRSELAKIYNRLIHRFFQTDGRSIYTIPLPQIAIGVVLEKV